jgi:hypothetical protein
MQVLSMLQMAVFDLYEIQHLELQHESRRPCQYEAPRDGKCILHYQQFRNYHLQSSGTD